VLKLLYACPTVLQLLDSDRSPTAAMEAEDLRL